MFDTPAGAGATATPYPVGGPAGGKMRA